jgi:predicted nuclease of restriction endonuclease-like (RecB) superfamily
MRPTQKNAYKALVEEIAGLVQQSREHAAKSVQRTANLVYWEIGKLIITRQNEYGWGKAIVEQLSADLQKKIGEGQSWSPRNLWLMRQLYEEYASPTNSTNTNLKQVVSDLIFPNLKQPVSDLEKLKLTVAEVPWGQNILILQKVKDIQARLFYLNATIKNRWSRSVLLHQIKADAYSHFLTNPKQHNFSVALPENLLEQAQESIKSVYSLDFLDINQPVTERDLESKLIENVKNLLLELGYGFCFIGNQYRLQLGKKEYFIDLLFYHRILKCIVAIELKTVEFEPEFVGKLDYYLHLVDEQLKQPDDNPSIGILLVPDKDHLEVEYALKIATKPIGVAEYKITKELPKNIKGNLPTKAEWAKMLKL